METAFAAEATTREVTGAKLAARDLHAAFGETFVVRGVDLELPPHSVTALVGPSGCGKSTLLRCLNRLHETLRGARVSGEVLLDGRDVYADDAVAVRRRVGMVFQRPNPFPTMSVRENVLAGFRLVGERPPEPRRVVEEMLERVGLWAEVKDRLDAPGTSLSGGQQQRLCIARTLAVEPDVVLMDEPCSALDPIAAGRIDELVLELKARYTIGLVTHGLSQARRTADRVAFLYLGELVEQGTVAQIFESPRDPRTQAYVRGHVG